MIMMIAWKRRDMNVNDHGEKGDYRYITNKQTNKRIINNLPVTGEHHLRKDKQTNKQTNKHTNKQTNSYLSQVNISSGHEDRVRERKELREGAGSLPHSPASGPAVVIL